MKQYIRFFIISQAILVATSASAGGSFGVLIETNLAGCRLIMDIDAPKGYKKHDNQGKEFEKNGLCKIQVPYIEPVNFCALTGMRISNQNIQNPHCHAMFGKHDENYKVTADKSKWYIEFTAQKGVMCDFVCVEL